MNREPRRALAIALIVATSGAQVTAPAVITVEGDCTLPDAIDAANTDLPVGGCDAGSGADEVLLTGDVLLTEVNNDTHGANGLPQVTSEIAITGGRFTIRRGNDAPPFRLFQVASNGTLSLASVRLTRGKLGPGYDGGAIHSLGSVRLVTSTVADNEAADGAGIWSAGSLTLTDGTIVDNNRASGHGGIWSSGSLIVSDTIVSSNQDGGIFSSASGRALLVDSNVSNNYARGPANPGAGIRSHGYLKLVGSTIEFNEGENADAPGIDASGPTVVIASTIRDNESNADDGGGIRIAGAGSLYLRDSTVSGNSVTRTYDGYGYGQGGGLHFREDATGTIVRSTISDNFASLTGGGLFLQGRARVTVVNTTISQNRAGPGARPDLAPLAIPPRRTLKDGGPEAAHRAVSFGAGAYNSDSASLTLVHSTVAGNGNGGLGGVEETIELSNSLVGEQAFGPNCGGFVLDRGNNFADEESCGAGFGELTGLDPALADNGGPTLTHALLPESSAIDATADCEQATDQRGFVRDALCDSGSFEFGAVPLTVALAGSCPGALTVGIRGASADGRVAVLRGSRAGLFELAAGPCAGTLVGLADPRAIVQVTADADGMFVTEVNAPAAACGDLLQVVDRLSCAVSNVAAIP